MVVQAYILIQTDVGKAAEVARAIAQVEGVTLAEDVTGPYDVIVRAEAKNVDELGKLVVSKVQNLPLLPWKRTGGRGHFIQLFGTETKWGCHVVEVPAAGVLD